MLDQVVRDVQVEIVQAALADLVQADLVEQVVQVEIVQADLADLDLVEIVQADLADLGQAVQVVASQARVHQVELRVERQAADHVVVRIQQVVVETPQVHLVNLAADLQRVASLSAQSVKSSTT